MHNTVFDETRAAQLREAADRAGTPFYLYDAAALRQRARDLQAQLPGVDFFYSLKANPNLSVVSTLTGAGLGAEVSSRLELETALAAGAAPGRILMVGPGKSAADLARAVACGIKAIVVESIGELDEIDALATAAGRIQDVALRVNPDFRVNGARLTMGGRATQFGIEQSALAQAITRAGTLPHLRLAGLHIYMGTRILSAEALASNTRQVLDLAARLMPGLARPLDFVDVGGGFGVPYYDDEAPLDLAQLGTLLRPLIADFRARHTTTRVAIELGRYMVAEAGIFVTSVRRVKQSRGENFAVCDGGANLHSAAAGQSFMRRNFPFVLLPRVARAPGPVARWSVTGPLCTPTDVILSGVECATPQPGDLICIRQSGAYGASASPVDFLGFGAPAEILADGSTLTLVRAAPDWQSRLAAQRPQPLPAPCLQAPRLQAPDLQPPDLPAPFDHPALGRLARLRPLFEQVGAQLETDPGAWTALWADPMVRALTTIGVPAPYNGFPLAATDLALSDCPHALHVALIERLARFDPGCILALPGPSLSGDAVRAAGSPDQIARFFEAYRTRPQGTFFAVTEPDVGSDASRGSTVITTDAGGTLRLSGTKMLVGGIARAAIGLVFARIGDSGRTALVMLQPAAATAHITITRLPTSGLKGADLCRIDIRDLPVTLDMLIGAGDGQPASLRDGFMAINGVFERNRPVVAALALGNARGMLDRLEAAGFGPSFTGMARCYTALLTQLAAVLHDQASGRPRSHRISEIKYQAVRFSDDLVRRIAAIAAPALFADSLLRRKMRDAKAFEYMEGTSNIHLLNAFRSYVAGVPA